MAKGVFEPPKNEELAEKIIRRSSEMENDRGTLDAHLEEVAARVFPSYVNQFTGHGQQDSKGGKKTDQQYDATAGIALTKFAAVMESLLTPRSSKWSRIVSVDKTLNAHRESREWFDAVNDLLFAYRNSPRANFASQKQEGYLQLGAFGTDPLFIDRPDGWLGFRYKSCSLADIYLKENHQGMIDVVHRRMNLTARQAWQKWGDNIPEEIKKKLEKNPDFEFKFWHCVQPREDVDYGRVDHKGMPFASYYVSVTGKKMMQEGGYRAFPYAIGRHVTAPGEVYGRSPAMQVLPNVKVLNEQKKTVLRHGHRAVAPILLAHDDGVIDTFSLKPDAINFGGVSADGRPLIHALPVGNLAIAREMMSDERQVIKDAFYVTLFEILVEDRRTMTATEVLERAREKGILLAPSMGRQQSESLGPQIEREIDLAITQGLLPPMPPMVAAAMGEYKVEYDSPLSRMMRTEEASGFFRWSEMALKIAAESQNPAVLDWIDVDAAMPELADINAVPVRWVSSMDKVLALREGRNQQQQTQQLVESLPGIAGLVKAGAGAAV